VKRTAILIAALAGVVLASPVLAQAPGEGFFGLSYGAVKTDGASLYTNTVDDGTSAGYKVYAGKMFDNNFGMEIGYYDLGKYGVNFAGAKIAETKASAVTVAGVLASAFGGGYWLHAKAGIVFSETQIRCVGPCVPALPPLADTTTRGVAGVLGAGLGAQLAHDVEMRIDYDHLGSVHHQIGNAAYRNAYDVLSVSLQFNF
jgi:OmpA-like transmembrane domain